MLFHAGKAITAGRLTGFCLLARRDVLDRLGGLDERYNLGFFEDDDLCARARRAGIQLAVAQDVFIHHFGSRTFKGLGIDCTKQLAENFARFKERWGPRRPTATACRMRRQSGTGQRPSPIPWPRRRRQAASRGCRCA